MQFFCINYPQRDLGREAISYSSILPVKGSQMLVCGLVASVTFFPFVGVQSALGYCVSLFGVLHSEHRLAKTRFMRFQLKRFQADDTGGRKLRSLEIGGGTMEIVPPPVDSDYYRVQ
jgi:hypothetical protein